jgi:transcriptional regulator GlxA family with amidase domain
MQAQSPIWPQFRKEHRGAGCEPGQRLAWLQGLEQITLQIQTAAQDPDLATEINTESHDVSVRSLQLIFSTEHRKKVGAWMRECQLSDAHHHLTTLTLSTMPISEVCAPWCFSAPSSFARTFVPLSAQIR